MENKDIFYYLEKDDIKNIKKLLKSNNVDLNKFDNHKITKPIHVATYYKNFELVKLFLEHGADPNSKNMINWTPLHLSIYHNCDDITFILLEHGADMTIKNTDGRIPLDYCNNMELKKGIERLLKLKELYK